MQKLVIALLLVIGFTYNTISQNDPQDAWFSFTADNGKMRNDSFVITGSYEFFDKDELSEDPADYMFTYNDYTFFIEDWLKCCPVIKDWQTNMKQHVANRKKAKKEHGQDLELTAAIGGQLIIFDKDYQKIYDSYQNSKNEYSGDVILHLKAPKIFITIQKKSKILKIIKADK